MTTGIKGLDHWAIVTGDEAKCTSFYQGVLGLKVGARPQLTFKGIWFYSGDVPIVHVISDRAFQPGQTGAFDHIALRWRDRTRKWNRSSRPTTSPFRHG